VPYKGLQLALPDLIQGNVSIMFDSLMTGKPHVESKRLNAFGISSRKRSDLLPGVATVAESGLPGFESWVYFGIFGPAGTPRAVVERVNAEMNRIIGDPAIQERFQTLGFESAGGSPADFSAVIASETAKWSKVIRDANVKAE
jgi:tripartite-type tricarboxylate transporter receptor subunit TctC